MCADVTNTTVEAVSVPSSGKFTPEQKIKYAILIRAAEWENKLLPDNLAPEDVDGLYNELVVADSHWEAMDEVRGSGDDTGLPCDWSRNYESKAVAAQMPDGSWVGWTYWYGGGKHGNPEGIDWMDEAYDLTCAEEEKVVTVRTFAKIEAG